MRESSKTSRTPMPAMPICWVRVWDRMTRGASRLPFVALLVCGAGGSNRAEEPESGTEWRQPSFTVRRPAAENGTIAMPRALRRRTYFGCVPIEFASVEINHESKGAVHDRP